MAGIVNIRAAGKNENELDNNWWDCVSQKSVLKGTEYVGNIKCYVIELETQKNDSLKFTKVWIDCREYLLIQAEVNSFMKNGIKFTMKCSDYRNIQGNAVLPYLSEIASDGKTQIISRITEVKTNNSLSPSLFELTSEEKESVTKSPLSREMPKDLDLIRKK